MSISPLIDRLIESFQVLPGVGPKGAQRMTLYLLQHNRSGAGRLAETLSEAIAQVGQCGHCRLGRYYVCKDGPVFSYDEIRANPRLWDD